jgi:heat shock protein HspQ
VFAENDQVFYSAYVSQQNLLVDDSQVPVEHPDVPVFFGGFDGESYEILENSKN